MTRVLLTGFEPFADAPVNPSWDAVELVGRTWDGTDELVVRKLPVAFGSAGRRLMEHIAAHTPDIVIATGVAEGRTGITPERIAINLRDASMPDNKGRRPVETPVLDGGPNAWWSTLPVTAIVDALRAAGIPASVSLSAGTYVCNDTFYALQHAMSGLDVPSGFIHVPATWEMRLGRDVPTLPLHEIARGLKIAVETTLRVRAASR